MRVLAILLLLSGWPTTLEQPTTASSRPAVVVIASLQYVPGFGDFPPPARILQLRSDGLLTVADDWRHGAGETRAYRLSKDELDEVVERLSQALDRMNQRKEVMDSGMHDDCHMLAIRISGHPRFVMVSGLDLKARGAPHANHGGDLHDRLAWHELKDILQEAVIAAAQKRENSHPSTQPVANP